MRFQSPQASNPPCRIGSTMPSSTPTGRQTRTTRATTAGGRTFPTSLSPSAMRSVRPSGIKKARMMPISSRARFTSASCRLECGKGSWRIFVGSVGNTSACGSAATPRANKIGSTASSSSPPATGRIG
ncbi:unnamed protein product [Phytomonas sp. EM1]|nr:unnamed protein product [Phytomonas sp. EM1]|eukprot:CCW65597.1 unnamed protein product [Phytomonas sp. isolate EM1]